MGWGGDTRGSRLELGVGGEGFLSMRRYNQELKKNKKKYKTRRCACVWWWYLPALSRGVSSPLPPIFGIECCRVLLVLLVGSGSAVDLSWANCEISQL